MSDEIRYIYVAIRADGAHKIGVSAYLEQRRLGLMVSVRQDVQFICFWPQAPDEAFRIERMAHDVLAEWALGEEWFKVSTRAACAAVLDAIEGFDSSRPVERPTWDEFYAAECAQWGKEAVDASFAKMNADWDAYWLARGSTRCGLDLIPDSSDDPT